MINTERDDMDAWYAPILNTARCVRPACTHGYGFENKDCPDCIRIQRDACATIGADHPSQVVKGSIWLTEE